MCYPIEWQLKICIYAGNPWTHSPCPTDSTCFFEYLIKIKITLNIIFRYRKLTVKFSWPSWRLSWTAAEIPASLLAQRKRSSSTTIFSNQNTRSVPRTDNDNVRTLVNIFGVTVCHCFLLSGPITLFEFIDTLTVTCSWTQGQLVAKNGQKEQELIARSKRQDSIWFPQAHDITTYCNEILIYCKLEQSWIYLEWGIDCNGLLELQTTYQISLIPIL